MSVDVLEVKSRKQFKCGYESREEVWSWGSDKDESIHVKAAYNPSGEYIGDPKMAFRLVSKRGIQPQKVDDDHSVCSIGYSVKDGKWYGWSHRAIYGFKIGSTCKKGDCHYVPNTFKELSADCHCRKGKKCEANATVPLAPVSQDDPEGEQIVSGPVAGIVNCNKKNCVFNTGRGEWTAETLADAKQMAIDFAKSVS